MSQFLPEKENTFLFIFFLLNRQEHRSGRFMLLPIRNHIMHMGLANAASALYPFRVLLDRAHEMTDRCGSLADAISHLKSTLTSLLSPCLTKFAPRTYRHHEHFGRYYGNCSKEGMILPMMLIHLSLQLP